MSTPLVPAPRGTLEFGRLCGEFSAAGGKSFRGGGWCSSSLPLLLVHGISPLISAVCDLYFPMLFICRAAVGLERTRVVSACNNFYVQDRVSCAAVIPGFFRIMKLD